MKIVFMGTPEFSVPILEAVAKEYEVSLVVTQPDKLVGRKQILTPSPVKECAMRLGIEVFQPESIKQDYQRVLDESPDLIITAAYGQFIPNEVLECGKFKPINVHGSLLPKYRGGAPIQRSIINGDAKTGITIMYMVSKMDAGDIISQREIDILDTDTNTTLFEKLSYVGRDLLLETLPNIFSGNINPIPQDLDKVVIARNLRHEEQFINWNKTSREIFNLVRGMAEEPGALTSINDTLYKIGKVAIVNEEVSGEPGEVINLTKKLYVKTLDGAISILELQQSGKKMMDIKSYLNGQKIINLSDTFKNDIM